MVKYAAAFLLVCAVIFSPAGVAACDHGCHQTGRYAQPQYQRPRMTTIAVIPVAGTDDGTWAPGGGAPFFDNASFGLDTGQRIFFLEVGAFVRFDFSSMQIPQGATISAATISFADGVASTSPKLKVIGESAPGLTAPVDLADVVGRTRTTASVHWEPTGGVGLKTSPDITAIVQEVVNSAAITSTWMLFVQDDGSAAGSHHMSASEFDGGGVTTLTITYTTAAAAEPSGGTPHGYHNSGLMRPQGGLMPLPGRH